MLSPQICCTLAQNAAQLPGLQSEVFPLFANSYQVRFMAASMGESAPVALAHTSALS